MPGKRPPLWTPTGIASLLENYRAKNERWRKLRELVPLSDEEIRQLIKGAPTPDWSIIKIKIWNPRDPILWLAYIGVAQNLLTTVFAEVIVQHFHWATLHKVVSFYIFIISLVFVIRYRISTPLVLSKAIELKIDQVNTTIWEHKHSQDADLERLKQERSRLWQAWTRSHSDSLRRTELESKIEEITQGIRHIEFELKESAKLFHELVQQLEQLKGIIVLESRVGPILETQAAISNAQRSVLSAQKTVEETEDWKIGMSLELRVGLEKLATLATEARQRSAELASQQSESNQNSSVFSQDKP